MTLFLESSTFVRHRLSFLGMVFLPLPGQLRLQKQTIPPGSYPGQTDAI